MKDSGSSALRLGVAVAVLLAAYLGMAWFLGRHIPANSTVAGVPVGGMSPHSAESTLRRALAAKEGAKLTLKAGDKTFEIDPRTAGRRSTTPARSTGCPGSAPSRRTSGTSSPVVPTRSSRPPWTEPGSRLP